MIPTLSVQELAQMKQKNEAFFLLDVREATEYEHANLKGHLIPLNELPNRLGELEPEDTIVVHCHHGRRSAAAVQLLLAQGFFKVYNLAGGIDAWSNEIDPSIPRY